jgi:hypothetical protein
MSEQFTLKTMSLSRKIDALEEELRKSNASDTSKPQVLPEPMPARSA